MRVFVTGAAGFIGAHVTERLLRDGHTVVGFDGLTSYYDVRLKRERLAAKTCGQHLCGAFTFHEANLLDFDTLHRLVDEAAPDCIIHLAAQPGVRYSISNPFACRAANLDGFLNVLECCRLAQTKPRLIYASSSSVYGKNHKLPFSEDQPVDQPVSLYAATKKANELMAHVYSHLYGIQMIGLRFFTAYGPWYRPDMALYLFADAMTKGHPISVFNNGDLWRDFTYIDDVVDGIVGCLEGTAFERYEIFNLGNNRSERILDVIEILAQELKVQPLLRFLPMQAGDVVATWASIDRLQAKTGYTPKTSIQDGIPCFAEWYISYAHQRLSQP